MKKLSEDIALVKSIKEDMENLTWEYVKTFANKDKSILINEDETKFSEMATMLNEQFKPDSFISIAEIMQIKSESITNHKKYKALISKYDIVVSRIKTHYDVLYIDRPTERVRIFDAIIGLPKDLIEDWNLQQDNIIVKYTEEGGLQEFLSKATGKEGV